MRTIHPNLFNRLMRLPAGIRADILEFIGATAVADDQLDRMLTDVDRMLEHGGAASLSDRWAISA